MSFIGQTSALLRQEFRAEFRNPYQLAGILLYVLAAVIIVYVALTRFSIMVWNPIFWVLLFFAAVSAAGRSFVLEQGRRQLYYYSLVSPEAILAAKFLYNTLLLFGLGIFLWGLLILFNGGDVGIDAAGNPVSSAGGNPIDDNGLFLLAILGGSIGLSAAFSFVAALATRAGGTATLLAILAFPLVIPLLLVLVRLGGYAIGLISGDFSTPLYLLLAIDLLLISAGMLLFPFVWRD
ncbi:ABC transporter permease [Lewinellaceae bacterium SD302]|nr:ABC transporter permease [Lewinellaceae bacterium SD302]